MADPAIRFVVPGPITQRTGGYGYDRRIVAALRGDGRTVRVEELPGEFPVCCGTAAAAARAVLDSAAAGEVLVIDGLALPAFAAPLAEGGESATVLALVHHPLALETGLSPDQQRDLRRIESTLLGRVDGVIATSGATAKLLAGFGVAADDVAVVVPGTDPAQRAAGSDGPAVQLICVGTLIPRKGHRLLIEALAGCADLPWRLRCFGSLTRDRDTADAARAAAEAHGLAHRIAFEGEAAPETLAAAYHGSDLFVLASALEGYGMAFAEALARGLPVVGSGAGAVRDTVPEQAGLIVPAGDREALRDALSRAIGDDDFRRKLAKGAHAAGRRLPDWTAAGRAFAAAVDRAAAR